MPTISTLGGSGSNNAAVSAGTVAQTTLFTTPATADYTYFVRIEFMSDSGLEVAMESAPGQSSDTYPGAVQVNSAFRQRGGVQYRKVGPNTAVVLMSRNKDVVSRTVYYTYEYVGIKIT